jgi:hypothetical protein
MRLAISNCSFKELSYYEKREEDHGWILVAAALLAGILIWFIVPYSPVKAEFAELTSYQLTKPTNQEGLSPMRILPLCPCRCRSTFSIADILVKPKCPT